MKWIVVLLIILLAVVTFRLNSTAEQAGQYRETALDLRQENEKSLCGYELMNYGLCNTPFTKMLGENSERVYIFIRNNLNETKDFAVMYHVIPEQELELIIPEGPFVVRPKEELSLYGFVKGIPQGEAKIVLKITADDEDYAIGQFYIR